MDDLYLIQTLTNELDTLAKAAVCFGEVYYDARDREIESLAEQGLKLVKKKLKERSSVYNKEISIFLEDADD